MNSVSLSTIIGDQIEKFSQPANPIYRIEFIESFAVPDCETFAPEVSTNWKSLLGELLPLNKKELIEKAKFVEWRDNGLKNPDWGRNLNINETDEWEDKIQYFHAGEENDIDYYMRVLRSENKIHHKLFKHIEKSFENERSVSSPRDNSVSFVFLKMTRIG